MLLTPLYGNFNPKVKPKLFWKQFLFIKKKNYYYYKILFFGIFLFILVYPLHRTWPFILSFCFKFPFSCIRASFYTPEQFSLNCSFAFLWPHALASPAVFPSIVPLPKSFHKPSFFSLSIYVRAFSDHMSCFCVSKIDRLFNICTPSTSYMLKRAKLVVHCKVSNFLTALKLRLNLMTDTVYHVGLANHGRAFFSAVCSFRKT